MDFQLLGPLDVLDGNAPVRFAAGKQRALLALLLLNANRTVARDRIIDDLWGDDLPESAQKMVQIHVSQLRKALPEPRLRTRAPGYVLEVRDDELDLARFERSVAAGGRSRRATLPARAGSCATRSRSGAGPPWPSSRSRSPGTRARVSWSFALPRSNCGSKPSSRLDINAKWSASSRR